MGRIVEVSPTTRLRAAHRGAEGERWLAELPRLIAELERRWSITVGPTVAGGTGSYVARVRTTDGQDAVLKLALPDPGFADQVRTIDSARGHGYVKLLASDVERHAMLQEALGLSMDRLRLSPEAQIEGLCATLRQAWELPKPTGANLGQAQAKAFGLAEMVDRLWSELGRPCSSEVVSQALRHRVGPVTEAGHGFGQRQGGAFGVGEVRRLAPGGYGEEPLVGLAGLPGRPHTCVDAGAATVDLARPQVDEVQRQLRNATLARRLVQAVDGLHGIGQDHRRIRHPCFHLRSPGASDWFVISVTKPEPKM